MQSASRFLVIKHYDAFEPQISSRTAVSEADCEHYPCRFCLWFDFIQPPLLPLPYKKYNITDMVIMQIMQCNTMQCNIMQYSAMQHNTRNTCLAEPREARGRMHFKILAMWEGEMEFLI